MDSQDLFTKKFLFILDNNVLLWRVDDDRMQNIHLPEIGLKVLLNSKVKNARK